MIIACTWTIQHLNVPEQRNGRDSGRVGGLKWKLKGFLQSIKWMVITMLAPEFIMGMACYDLLWGMKCDRKLRRFASQDQVPWTLAHTHYANMGGFAIQSGVQEDVRAPYIPSKKVNTEKADVSGTQVIDNDKVLQESHPTAVSENGGSYPYHNPYHLTALGICKLREDGTLQKLPSISEEELSDKSKSNSFIKAIAIFQIIWATMQIIVRTVRKIAISQLELAVIAFAACAIIIYVLYWSKPKDISTVTAIIQYQGQIPKDILQGIENCTKFHSFGTFFFAIMTSKNKAKPRHAGLRIENDTVERSKDENYESTLPLAMIVMAFGATLFGGIHIGAWNFEFPSRTELIFWRCASVFSAAYGLTLIMFGISTSTAHVPVKIEGIFISMWTFLYVMARLFLLVEIFRTLYFLPPDAYISTWTTNIPHVI